MRLATDWNLPIGWPNCLRLRTCSMQRSSWRRIVPKQGCSWHVAVVKQHLGHECCAQSHLVFLFSDAKSPRSFFDNERADSGGAELRVKGRVDREQIHDWSICHENFPAIQNVVTLMFPDAGLHGKDIRASIRLTSTISTDETSIG